MVCKEKHFIRAFSKEKLILITWITRLALLSEEGWSFLYAEVLSRFKELDALKCNCTNCFADKVNLKHLISRLITDGHIEKNKEPINFTGIGDCGRRLPPRA